jgi:hypothetical protein
LSEAKRGATTGHFGKFGGSYSQIASMIEAKYTLTDRFRVSGAATLAYYDVSGVPGMDDRRQVSVQSISFSARYRVLDHQQAPFALTLSAEPRRGFVDEWSGAPADEIGLPMSFCRRAGLTDERSVRVTSK